MSIQDGNPVNAAYTNTKLASKEDDNTLAGKQALTHNNIESGANILDLQKTVNDLVAIIAALGTGNTVTNIGGAVELFKEKVGVDLRFRTVAGTNSVTVALNGDTVEFGHPIEFLAADPGAPAPNSLWFNYTEKVWKFYDGATTIEIGSDYVDLTTNQTIGGEKTFSNKAFFSDEIEVTGKLTALGDFEVQGTLTWVNTTNLEVTDNNITINKDGTDATAEGAGFDVERVSTNGCLQFDSNLETYWKLGLAGACNEVGVMVKSDEATILGLGSYLTSARYYATDTGDHYIYNAVQAQLIKIGSGSGGGGSLDIFFQEPFGPDNSEASDFSKGNSVVFLDGGAGPLVGALSDETVAPLSGTNSLRYDSAPSSINDWIASPGIPIDLKERGNDASITFYYTLSNANAKFEVVVYDVTNSKKLNSPLDEIAFSDGRKRFQTAFYIPNNCTEIKYGFQAVQENGGGPVLVVDDVEFSVNPFLEARLDNITEWQSYTPTISSFGTVTNLDAKYRRVGDEIQVRAFFKAGTTVASIANISLPDGLSIDANKCIDDRKQACGTWYTTTTSAVDVANASNSNGVMHIDTTTSATEMFFATDLNTTASGVSFNRDNASSFCGANAQMSITFSAPIEGWTATSTHIVTPAKSNLTDFIEYTPTYQALGTPTGTVKYKRVGDALHIHGTITTGTQDGSEIQIGLPVIDGVQMTVKGGVNVEAVGAAYYNPAAISPNYVMIATNGDSYLNVGYTGQSGYGTAKAGTDIWGTGSLISFHAIVNVNELSSDATFLAAVPVQKVAYIKDVKASGVAGGASAANTVLTRDLNTVEGDSSILSLSSNQFTLQKGRYLIEAESPVYVAGRAQLFVYSVTDSVYIIDGASGAWASPSNDQTDISKLSGEITLASSKTFELRQWTQEGKAVNGLGLATDIDPSNPQSGEVYTIIKITKLR